ncbi:hypothetical protein [Streptomyces echinatus]|uniref:hypothetical protein n=1 Tax=Streptomyces echinatus TaxID=67293 RepID=UPI001CECB566|nr:hypothetical protein [Streptomyces echinatus]
MLPLDPQADIGRRAWVTCPNCEDHRGCATCAQGRRCADHWRYLLTNTGSLLHLQCPSCTHIWDHETGFGATRTRWTRTTSGLRRK